MNNEDKIKIIDRIKKHIHKENNGYCGVGWASKQILGETFSPTKWQIKSIASIITKDGKYIKETAEHKTYYDIDILINPNSNWFRRNPLKTELIRVLVAIIIATITSIITTEIKLKNEPPKTTQEQAIIDNQQVESKTFPKVEQDNSSLE
ncbi:MAG TPA: hypothetical protein VLZ11_08205 [Flavobacterium sp.]|nr:hypothetical protein [Flavobacterium sp.]